MTLLNCNAYKWVRTVPYLTEYDEGNNNGIYYYADSVEHGTCAINDMLIVAGGLNVYVLFLHFFSENYLKELLYSSTI
jgi:hypothetical protein